jgi:uncharacterized membrane protein YhaH (DUF805 family)
MELAIDRENYLFSFCSMDTTTPMWETPVVWSVSSYGLKRLLNRAWTILFKEPRWKGRVSRGEYVMSSLVLGVITSVITAPLSWLLPVGVLVVNILAQIRLLWPIVRRCHDLNKSWRFVGIPLLIVLVGMLIIGLSWASITWPQMMLQYGAGMSLYTLIAMGLMLIWMTWFIIICLRLVFSKWTLGDNAYGIDPLVHQPIGNGLYRRTAILLIVVSLAISFFEKPAPLTIEQQQLMQDITG